MSWFTRHIAQKKLILPFYHTVSDGNLSHIHNLYSAKSTQQFKKDIEALLKNYHPISSIEELQKPIKKPSFLLSFDDGLSECYDIVTPILEQKGINAVFFINPDFVDNKALFYRYKISLLINEKDRFAVMEKELKVAEKFNKSVLNSLKSLKFQDDEFINQIAQKAHVNFNEFLKVKKPYMTKNQIVELSQKGFYIGAHSMQHPYYHHISLEEQLQQTRESLQWIQKEIPSEKQVLFAFPFTDFGVSVQFFKQIKKEYPYLLTFGTSGIKDEEISFHFQRLPMEKTHLSAKKFIAKEQMLYIAKKLINKAKAER